MRVERGSERRKREEGIKGECQKEDRARGKCERERMKDRNEI